MEASSPLAAIRRPAHLFGERGSCRSNVGHYSPDRPRAFNLREQLGINASKKAYFNDEFLRGSSPSVTLAADLCQNFRIDQDNSPKFPTPRRALFTSNMMTALESRDYMTAPPLLPSSPPPCGMVVEMMDISPLPHKAPAPTPIICEVEVESPTLMEDVEETDVQELPLPQQVSAEPPKPVVPLPAPSERRKVPLRRPSLSRVKGYSTSSVLPTRANADNQLPPFRFGGDRRLSGSSSSLSLGECFQASPPPPQERRPQTANSPTASGPGPLRLRTQFPSLGNASAARTGSPISSHSRRPSNPFMRPRKQYRRSLSMFESSGEMMKPKKEEPPAPTLAAVMDLEEPHELVLPHYFPEDQTDSIPRIKRSTLLDVLDGQFNEHFDQKMVIDCRFEYEYEGGHIDGAVNYNDKDLLATHLLRTPMDGRTLIIFHCEYSAHRAPLMARHVRAEDRSINAEFYPRLTYPEVYILEGGYSAFFNEHRERCYPQAYVEMDAAEHAFTCEREMGRLRQNRKGLSRAQTFAFGDDCRSVQDSPTAPGRGPSYDDSPTSMMMLGASPVLGKERCHARRMASY